MTAPSPYLVLALTAFGCATGCSHTEPHPCDPTSYAALSATCGDDADVCDAKIAERELFCADQIRGGK